MNVALIPTTNSSCRSPRWATLWMTAVIQLNGVEPSGRNFSPRYLKCQVPKQQPGRRHQRPKCWGEDITYNKPEGTRWENWRQGAEQEFKPGTRKREESKCWSKEIHREKKREEEKEGRKKGKKEWKEDKSAREQQSGCTAQETGSCETWGPLHTRLPRSTFSGITMVLQLATVGVFTPGKKENTTNQSLFFQQAECQAFLSTSLMWSLILKTKICELSFLVGRFIGTWVEQSCSNSCEEREMNESVHEWIFLKGFLIRTPKGEAL